MGEGEGGGVMEFPTRAMFYLVLAGLTWAAFAVIGWVVLGIRSHPMAAAVFVALMAGATPLGMLGITAMLFKAGGMKDD